MLQTAPQGVYKHILIYQKSCKGLDQKLGREWSYNATNVRFFIKIGILNAILDSL